MNRVQNRKHLIWMERCLTALVLCCILAYLTVFAVLNVQGFQRICNADVYADMQVAVRMWEQKTLFPEGWSFGNQFYVVATPVLAALFYGVTGNGNAAMILATELMTVLILLSFLWLLRGFTKDLLIQAVCCLLLIASCIAPYGHYSINSMLFFTQASFYACYMITMFVVFGDYTRTFDSDKPRVGSWILSLALSFATGMQSMRQTVIMVLPILACEGYLAFRRVLQHGKPWDRTNYRSLLRALSYGASNAAGIVTIKLLDVPNASIYGQIQMVSLDGIFARLERVVTAICEISSFDYVLLGDYSPKLALVIVFMIALVIVAAVLWLARIRYQETALELCWLLCLVGIVGVFLSTVVLNITLRSIYVFMWFPLVAFSGLMLLKKLPTLLKNGLILLICLLSLWGLNSTYMSSVSMVMQEGTTDSEQMCQWAMDNGYEYVYGDYWRGVPGIAVCSNGTIEAGCWHTAETIFQVEPFNTPQDIYGEAENAKAIYVFTEYDEAQGLETAYQRGVALTKVAEFGNFRAYTAAEQLMQPHIKKPS